MDLDCGIAESPHIFKECHTILKVVLHYTYQKKIEMDISIIHNSEMMTHNLVQGSRSLRVGGSLSPHSNILNPPLHMHGQQKWRNKFLKLIFKAYNEGNK